MKKALSWITVLAGIWLIIAPWVLTFTESPQAMWNSIVLGIIVGVIGLVEALGGGKQETPTV